MLKGLLFLIQATNDSWNGSVYLGNQSTTINLPSGEPVLIEDEYSSRVIPQQNQK